MIQEGPMESPKGLKPSPPENSGLCLESSLLGWILLTDRISTEHLLESGRERQNPGRKHEDRNRARERLCSWL